MPEQSELFAGHDAEYLSKFDGYGIKHLRSYLFALIDARTTRDGNGIKAAELLYKILKDESLAKDDGTGNLLDLIARDDTFIAPDEEIPPNPIL